MSIRAKGITVETSSFLLIIKVDVVLLDMNDRLSKERVCFSNDSGGDLCVSLGIVDPNWARILTSS
jgi:hypothetical protein